MKHRKKSLGIIFLTVFIDLIGFGIVIPLSPYLAKELGATPFQVGLLMAIYSGMQFLFSPLWGQLS
ncbi:MAG: MFS transporter, partial [Bdellovibrio sp.]